MAPTNGNGCGCEGPDDDAGTPACATDATSSLNFGPQVGYRVFREGFQRLLGGTFPSQATVHLKPSPVFVAPPSVASGIKQAPPSTITTAFLDARGCSCPSNMTNPSHDGILQRGRQTLQPVSAQPPFGASAIPIALAASTSRIDSSLGFGALVGYRLLREGRMRLLGGLHWPAYFADVASVAASAVGAAPVAAAIADGPPTATSSGASYGQSPAEPFVTTDPSVNYTRRRNKDGRPRPLDAPIPTASLLFSLKCRFSRTYSSSPLLVAVLHNPTGVDIGSYTVSIDWGNGLSGPGFLQPIPVLATNAIAAKVFGQPLYTDTSDTRYMAQVHVTDRAGRVLTVNSLITVMQR